MLRLKRRMQSRGFRNTKGVTRISSKNRKKKVCIYLSTVLLRHPPVLKCPSSRGQMILMYPDRRIKITCSKSSLSFDNTRCQRDGEGARKGILDLTWNYWVTVFLCQVLVTSWLDVLVSQYHSHHLCPLSLSTVNRLLTLDHKWLWRRPKQQARAITRLLAAVTYLGAVGRFSSAALFQ